MWKCGSQAIKMLLSFGTPCTNCVTSLVVTLPQVVRWLYQADNCVTCWSDKPISGGLSSSAVIALRGPSTKGVLLMPSERAADGRLLGNIEYSRSLAMSVTEECLADASSHLVASIKADVDSVAVDRGRVSNVLSFGSGQTVFFCLENSMLRLLLI